MAYVVSPRRQDAQNLFYYIIPKNLTRELQKYQIEATKSATNRYT
jgi:hypothetical protein